MRIHGTLAKWNDERGFGFVVLPQTHEEIFVHISAFPRDGVRPRIGETISFEVRTSRDGRKRAEAVERPGSRKSAARNRVAPGNDWRRVLGSVFAVAAVSAIGLVGYSSFTSRLDGGVSPAVFPAVGSTSQFSCDARTHCSQMTSCEEARYFLIHCPGTQMDGDGDGEPCEQQWCN